MARKVGSLFFSTIHRMARMQRRALKLVSVTTPKQRKPAKRKAVKQASNTKPKAPAATPSQPTGKGIWQDLLYATPASGTELLGRMAYSLYRPAKQPVAKMPLIVMLHGCQQSPYEMALGSRMNQLADKKGFVIVYPQQARRVQAMRCWRWFQPDAEHGLAEADAIASLATSIVRRYRLDATRVYVAGLSAGASMAGLVVLRHPHVFAATAMHSGAVLGYAHDATTGLRTMRKASPVDPVELINPLAHGTAPSGRPLLILHGKRDHLVSMQNAGQLAAQFAHLNAASASRERVLAKGTHREYVRQDFLNGNSIMVRLCLLKEVGHAWSGGNSKLKFSSKDGPSASVLLWQFFSMHNR